MNENHLTDSVDDSFGEDELLPDAAGDTEDEDAAPAPIRKMPPNAGKGRPKGSRNRASVELGAMVDKALHEAGGWRYLVKQAHDNPTAFLALVARRLPKEIKAEITAEMTVRAETRRDLIERSVSLMIAIQSGQLQSERDTQRAEAAGRLIEEAKAMLPNEQRIGYEGSVSSEPSSVIAGDGSGESGGARATLSPLAGLVLPAVLL